MSRRSQTETAVLGALSVMPMTGYAVRQSIHDVLGHFWSESFGQIYPTLARLEADGLIERQDGATGPYAITQAGLARLTLLLSESITDAPPRNGLMLRLFFGRHLGPDACRRLIEQAAAEAAGRLAAFASVRAEIAAETGTEVDRPYWLLTLSAGEHAARAVLAWADEALVEIDTWGAG